MLAGGRAGWGQGWREAALAVVAVGCSSLSSGLIEPKISIGAIQTVLGCENG